MDLDPSRPMARAGLAAWVAAAALLCGCHTTRPLTDPPPSTEGLATAAPGAPALRVAGRHFVDPDGRVVLLRGVNLSGDAKVPPFLPLDDPTALDPLLALGINAVRLLFLWEAYEPRPGEYDERYLTRLVTIADEAWRRGLYVIVDFHQDGLSRWASRGCGAGFPAWALSPRARRAEPDNGCGCSGWVFAMVTDRDVRRSLADFYADTHGARSRYLAMLGRVAEAFRGCPGVVGYDLLNEPWGSERDELAPLYRDVAASLRARHPTAILFVAGHGSTSCGLQTGLPRPGFDNFAYTPHCYDALAVAVNAWYGSTRPIDRNFAAMCAKADEWGVPLFVGEFGIGGEARRGGDLIAAVYDRLDAAMASGAQWNYTPRWNERDRDGWNGEDFSILDDQARARPTFRPRPYPQKIAGIPLRFRYRPPGDQPAEWECSWDHHPERGATEIFVPSELFPPDSVLAVDPPDLICSRDEARQLLTVRCSKATPVSISLTAPRG